MISLSCARSTHCFNEGKGFQLRKCAANSPIFLDEISNSQHDLKNHVLSNNETLKVFGLSWLSRDDAFGFVIASPVLTTHTRRSILSFIAKLYNWDGRRLSLLLRRFCYKNSSYLRTIGMPQYQIYNAIGRIELTICRTWRAFESRVGQSSTKTIYYWKRTDLPTRQIVPML